MIITPDLFIGFDTQKRICGIYKVTSPTGKIYIGQSTNAVRRIYKYTRLLCEKQPKLYNSLKKHGWQNHIFEVIHQCDKSELNELEIYYIDLFQTFNNNNGLNLRTGGNHYSMSEETKSKLREANIGKIYSVETNNKKGYRNGVSSKGVSLPESTKAKMKYKQLHRTEEHIANHKKSARSGSDNHMFGKKWTTEQKQKHVIKLLKRKVLNEF